ncbi:effector-associated constant component EACC1 [Streptomyces piniterrae]|uniref:effector-associated constant component EACC1 n=1 Tax=Streptomyces piniterrae TaxID=2571125 RepID=UPI001FE29779|nr:hypothetical protein [Streptomyces piniterrae]
MRVDVQVDGGERELRSLYDWLRQDAAVRRGAHVALPQAPSTPDQMGTLADVLQLVTDNGWSAASFAIALSTWRQTRPGRRSVTVQRGETTVTMENGSEAELNRLIEMLERPTGDAGGAGDQEGR